MDQENRNNVYGAFVAVCLSLVSTVGSRFIGLVPSGIIFVIGISGVLFFTIRLVWDRYGRPSGTLPKAALNAAYVVAAVLVFALASDVYSQVTKPPTMAPPVAEAKPALKPLSYQICGGFSISPNDHKTHNFQLEIDPLSPNVQELTLHIKHWFVQFAKRPGEAVGTDVMRLASKGSVIQGVTRQEAIGARVRFNPPQRLIGRVTGTYHYEMSFGPDEDTATTPIEINGDIAVNFGPDGLPHSSVMFTPTTGKNMNFDPTPCEVDPSARM